MAEANTAGDSNMSDEDPTRMCDPCKFRGINTQAGIFCQVCSEYLCDTCEEVHRSLRATRDHELKPFDVWKRRSIKQKSLISSIMTCTVHDSETLTLFCFKHDVAICVRCSSIKHRRCEIKMLKEVVRETKAKTEVGLFLEKIRSLSTEIIELRDLRERDKRQILKCCGEAKQDVIELKRKVIEWIEKLAKDMEDNICDTEEKLTIKTENDIKATNEMSDQLKETSDSFECLGNAYQEAAFVLTKKETYKLDEGKEATDDILKEIKPVKLDFHKSDKLVTLISEVTSMGIFKTDDPGICDQQISSDDSRICFPQISSLTRRNINIGSTRGVTGCVFMPDGRLVVCNSNSVKVLSEDFKLQSEIKTDQVWDVAVVSENQVIVSQIGKKNLLYLNISGAIAKGKTIQIGMKCYGVDYNNDKIYVMCHDSKGQGGTVKILTMTGDTVHTFNVSQGYPYYIAVNSAGDRIVLSTDTSHGVQCIDNNGTTIYTYSDSQLRGSLGLLFDSYDNFMVCGRVTNILHVVNSGGIKQKIILTSKDGINQPYCLAYRPSDKTLVIGQLSASLLVIKLN